MVLHLSFALHFQSPPPLIQFVVRCPNVVSWISFFLVLEEPPPFLVPEFLLDFFLPNPLL